jgi:Caudovirus prohead serine protease
MGTIEFVSPDLYPFGDTIYKLVVGGFINAVSVGFLPIEYSFVENNPDRGWGIDFKRQQLLEVSVCPIPANANALVEARSVGIDTPPLSQWAARALDRGRSTMSRTDLVRLREWAKGRPSATVTSFTAFRKERDLARTAAIRARTGAGRDDSCAGQLARAAEIRARVGLPDLRAMHEQEEELRRRDRYAAIDAAMRAVSW